MNQEEVTQKEVPPLGAMTLDLEGGILSSTGELADDKRVANSIYRILQDTNGLVKGPSGKPDLFKRLAVTFQQFSFYITISNNNIQIIKQKVGE